MGKLMQRVASKSRRTLAANLRRRPLRIDSPVPLVSFTFDDAPRSAFETGADLLEASGVRATYYVSLGLLDAETEIGRVGDLDCLRRAVAAGHELGCHTFDHLDAWHVSPGRYIDSVDANQAALTRYLPGMVFRTFAYPKSGPTLRVKAALERRFDCCRAGGQTFNRGSADRNALNAVFLDKRAGVDLTSAKALIAENARMRGWLIFVAHGIEERSSPFHCTPEYLREIVRSAVDSGADLLPVTEALQQLLKVGDPIDDVDHQEPGRLG